MTVCSGMALQGLYKFSKFSSIPNFLNINGCMFSYYFLLVFMYFTCIHVFLKQWEKYAGLFYTQKQPNSANIAVSKYESFNIWLDLSKVNRQYIYQIWLNWNRNIFANDLINFHSRNLLANGYCLGKCQLLFDKCY